MYLFVATDDDCKMIKMRVNAFPLLRYVAPQKNKIIIDWRKEWQIIGNKNVHFCIVWEKLSSVRVKKTVVCERGYYDEITNRLSVIERKRRNRIDYYVLRGDNIKKTSECVACGKQFRVRIIPESVNDMHFGPVHLDILMYHIVPFLDCEVGKLAELSIRLNLIFRTNFRVNEMGKYVVREMKWNFGEMLYEHFDDLCSRGCAESCNLIGKICGERWMPSRARLLVGRRGRVGGLRVGDMEMDDVLAHRLRVAAFRTDFVDQVEANATISMVQNYPIPSFRMVMMNNLLPHVGF